MRFAEYAKMYVALAGLLASAALGVPDFPATYKLPAMLVVAVAGAFATWKVQNAPAPTPPVNWKSQGPAWEEPPYVDDYFDAP